MTGVGEVSVPIEGDGRDFCGQRGHRDRGQLVVHGLGPMSVDLVHGRRPDYPFVVDRVIVAQRDRHRHPGGDRDDVWLEVRVVEADRQVRRVGAGRAAACKNRDQRTDQQEPIHGWASPCRKSMAAVNQSLDPVGGGAGGSNPAATVEGVPAPVASTARS